MRGEERRRSSVLLHHFEYSRQIFSPGTIDHIKAFFLNIRKAITLWLVQIDLLKV